MMTNKFGKERLSGTVFTNNKGRAHSPYDDPIEIIVSKLQDSDGIKTKAQVAQKLQWMGSK
jgi:hypothetical protein